MGFYCEKIIQALICAQDWLKPSTKLDMNDFDELQDLVKGNVYFFISF